MTIRTAFAALALLLASAGAEAQSLHLNEIYCRDPYIVVDQKNECYYLVRSSSSDVFDIEGNAIGGVEIYTSRDLEMWEGPHKVLSVPADNWITGTVWAPEMHYYKGRYYIFATLNTTLTWKDANDGRSPYRFRGTQIFKSKAPFGPFEAFDKVPCTPMDQMCLDGTLWVEDGQPYMVYCHEWVEVYDGEMVVVKLKKDLSGPDGNPLRLFCASAAPWASKTEGKVDFITDAPFLYKTRTGKLLMIWSSFSDSGYTVGIAESVTGKVTGPWKQQEKPLYSKDGGHAMIFRSLDGRLMLSLHSPNGGGLERAHFIEIEDMGDTLRVK